MPRRRAAHTQADIDRALKAARKADMTIIVTADGSILFIDKVTVNESIAGVTVSSQLAKKRDIVL